MDSIRATSPRKELLKNARDEELAELLATQRTVTGVINSRKDDELQSRRIDRNHFYGLINGYGKISAKRAEEFRGRVHFKLNEVDAELRETRNRLIIQATGVYEDAMDKGNRKKRGDLAIFAAKHTLSAGGFFDGRSGKDSEDEDENSLDLTKLSDKELRAVLKAITTVKNKCED